MNDPILPPLDITTEDCQRAKSIAIANDFDTICMWIACRERQIADSLERERNLTRERDSYARKIAIIFDESTYSDSLGVEQSGFSVCRWCGGGSSPGRGDFRHKTPCLLDDEELEKKVSYVWEIEKASDDRITEPEAERDRLREALIRAERKLSAYVGVCKGDKELTDTVLPMAHAALAASPTKS
jgi:hypothetical protein